MVIRLFDRLNFHRRLEHRICHDGFIPQNLCIEELIRNIVDKYEVSLGDYERNYLFVEGNIVEDILRFVEDTGDYSRFDIAI